MTKTFQRGYLATLADRTAKRLLRLGAKNPSELTDAAIRDECDAVSGFELDTMQLDILVSMVVSRVTRARM